MAACQCSLLIHFDRCLKKGELVEAGTHEELMETNGEYATLYNIQAQAFQTS